MNDQSSSRHSFFTINTMKSLVKNYVSLQGSIGAGKSTVMASIRRYIAKNKLSIIEDYDPDRDTEEKDYFLIVDEPLDQWMKEAYSIKRLGEENSLLDEKDLYSILELFYGDMESYGFLFQIAAFTSRLEKIIEALNKINEKALTSLVKPRVHIIAERSLRTDRLFFKNLYDCGFVSHLEWMLYSEFFDIICEDVIRAENHVIYVHTSPDKCFERLNKRHRDGEVVEKKADPIIHLLHLQLDELNKEMEERGVLFHQQSDSYREMYYKYDNALIQRKKKASRSGGVTLEYLRSLDREHDEMMNALTIPVIRVEFDEDMCENEIDVIVEGLMVNLTNSL